MVNKKIKNATPTLCDGIQFKSKSEASAYNELKKHFEDVQYEPFRIVLMNAFTPKKDNYYCLNKRNKTYGCQQSLIRPITYTPDFVINQQYMLEVKGVPNDCYPLKQKLLRQWMNDKDLMFFEVRNKTQLQQAINIIEDDIRRSKLEG